MRFRNAAVAALATGLLAPGAALAQDPSYPEPKDPGKVTPAPSGKGKTLRVCKQGCKFRKIQAAVNRAKAGDKVKVANGTYREAVAVRGAKKSYLKLVGNPGAPRKVVLKGGGGRQNGVLVDGADQVTVRGFKAKGYAANGFFFVNVVGYSARDLIAAKTGVYGVYAFNSKAGRCATPRRTTTATPASTSARRRRRTAPSARSSATSSRGATRSASARRTCAT